MHEKINRLYVLSLYIPVEPLNPLCSYMLLILLISVKYLKFKETVRVFGWIFKLHKSVRTENIESILFGLQQMKLCEGVQNLEVLNSFSVKHHTVSKKLDVDNERKIETNLKNSVEDHYYRSQNCQLLMSDVSSTVTCVFCQQFTTKELRVIEKKRGECNQPVNLKAPISATSSSRLLATIQHQRAENKELEKLVTQLRATIEQKSVKVEKSLHSDLQDMFKTIDQRKLSPFLKLFWEQQMDYIQQNPTRVFNL